MFNISVAQAQAQIPKCFSLSVLAISAFLFLLLLDAEGVPITCIALPLLF